MTNQEIEILHLCGEILIHAKRDDDIDKCLFSVKVNAGLAR